MPSELRRIPSLPTPQHYADDEGHIWFEEKGVIKPLRETVLGNGYLGVQVRIGERKSLRRVHVLVAEAFLGPRPTGKIVRHVDGYKRSNRPTGLVYGTHKENSADARRHGTAKYGENHPNAKLNAEQVAGVRFALQFGVPRRAIAQRLNVSVSAVHDIALGRRWRPESTASPAPATP